MQVDPAALDAERIYKFMIGAIMPRPIAVVGTRSPDGTSVNLAPFSFFCGVGSNPMTLCFCPANDDAGAEKDTLRNAKPIAEGGSGEFTVSVAPHRIIRQVVAAAEGLNYGDSEFQLTGLTPVSGVRVHAPRVAESPIAFECRTLQVIRTNPGAPSGGNIVLGAVELIHVDDAVIDARGRLDAARLDLVGRMAGLSYCTTRERFDLPWGRAAVEGA
ncbi:MAG: flavin reductase family protein [Phycisphaerae bacterium]|nr:flavin reductase family protein [Phycisphaerae bacterium]